MDKPPGGTVVPLMRLRNDSDVGLIGFEIAAKVVQDESNVGVNRAEVWMVAVCGQPNPLGGLHVENIPYRMIGFAMSDELIDKFNEMKAKRVEASPLIVAG